MSAFYAFPQIIKQYFWFYGDDFAACQAPKNNNIIQYDLDAQHAGCLAGGSIGYRSAGQGGRLDPIIELMKL